MVTTASQVHLEEEDHSYWRNGKRVEWPSLTGIIDDCNMRYSPNSSIPARVFAAAGERGTMVHKAMALEIVGELDYMTVDDQFLPYLESWAELRSFLDDFEVVTTELSLLHPTMRYCCTLDLLCRWNGYPAILDWKTSQKMHDGTGDQLAGQRLALAQDAMNLPEWWSWEDVKLLGIHLRKNGVAEVYPYEFSKHKSIFEATSTVWWTRYLRGTV